MPAAPISIIGRACRLQDKYAGVRRAIADIFELNHRCYGYRRMQAALRRQCMRLSGKVVQRLMKQECLVVAKPKRRRYGSYLGEISPAPENLVNRDFTAAAPNEKWLTDISEFQIAAGKVYLSPMIDCFDGQVVSWSIGTRPDAELVNTMLDAAIETIPGEQRTACRALRSWSPLPLAWMAIAHHGCQADSIDVTQGVLA